MHVHTWASFEGLAGVIETKSGTLAGTPPADIMFVAAFFVVIRHLRGRLGEAGLAWQVDAGGASEYFGLTGLGDEEFRAGDISYVDDLLIPYAAPADRLIEGLQSIATIVCEVFSRYGFEVNMKANKTEALISFFGEGAELAKRRAQSVFHEGIPLCPSKGAPCRLLCTHGYRHLGTRMVSAGTLMPEIKARMASMREAARPLVGRVLRRTSVPVPKRLAVAKAVMFSKGLFQAAVWPKLQAREYAVVHAQVMSILRHVLAQDNVKDGVFVSDNEVVRRLGAMAPACLLIESKFGFFVRCLVRQSPDLLKLIFAGRRAKRSWLAGLMADLSFMADNGEQFSELRGASLKQWIAVIMDRPLAMKAAVRKFLMNPLINEQNSWAKAKLTRQLGVSQTCDDCGVAFPSLQALSVHRVRKHGWRHEVRVHIDTTFCTVCLLEFHARNRVINHLAYGSPICLANLLARGPVISWEAANALDDEERVGEGRNRSAGWGRGKALAPCCRLSGPLLPVVLGEGQEVSGRHPLGGRHRWHL